MALRLLLMLVLLLICVPLHYLWKLLGLDRMWPRVFLTGVGHAAGIDLKRRGKRVPGALLLANHVSWMDILALSHAANSAYVAHDGLAQFGLLKWLCEMNETIFVARHRRTSVGEQTDAIRAALDHGGTLTLFPEGTTSDGTDLLPFKSSLLGALEPLPEGATVQPVLLAYEDVPQVSWVGDEPGLDNFKRILARVKPVRLTVHFLPPLSGDELTNRKTMTAAAQKAIAGAMR
ncbi:lysophospholipid acyltransferase family protein [Aurantiacibacter sp. MUD61]|uniref:lysophospholipid acyltransferase family protein n=1 Tax=Aurantiacibacter sp. MUD61 TaxID=3009083 RepID=UPI0022EFF168|nr:lysophospholipid acyltransferase family protein [Aurantiacibacter sp. MUD61]